MISGYDKLHQFWRLGRLLSVEMPLPLISRTNASFFPAIDMYILELFNKGFKGVTDKILVDFPTFESLWILDGCDSYPRI